eukprot:7228613-Pyramimonas_sp.AAC.1
MLNSNIVAARGRECKTLREQHEENGHLELAGGVATVFSMSCSGSTTSASRRCRVTSTSPRWRLRYDGNSDFA